MTLGHAKAKANVRVNVIDDGAAYPHCLTEIRGEITDLRNVSI